MRCADQGGRYGAGGKFLIIRLDPARGRGTLNLITEDGLGE